MKIGEQLAAEWRLELDELDRSIAGYEAGQMTAEFNGREYTSEQLRILRQRRMALQDALAVLELPI